jgi:hypothetical protein
MIHFFTLVSFTSAQQVTDDFTVLRKVIIHRTDTQETHITTFRIEQFSIDMLLHASVLQQTKHANLSIKNLLSSTQPHS